MTDHGARAHAEWAASSSARNFACAGNLALAATNTTPEVENFAAAWGTACHQVSEKCLRSSTYAAELIGCTEQTKEHEIEIDEELVNTAQVYIDYVRDRIAEYRAEFGEDPIVIYEQHFSLTEALKTPYEAGGTGDTVIYFPKWKLIETVDLKGGRGIRVEVKENKQLRTYGLGSVIANQGRDIEKVMSTIVQPRMHHADGRIRSETIHIADLVEWTADLLAAMRRAKDAEAAFATMSLAEWSDKYLTPGDHCTFCRAEGFCKKREQQSLSIVPLWYDDLGQPQITPVEDTPEETARKLDLLDVLQEWIGAYRAHAKARAEAGTVFPDYQLSESIGHRKWVDEAKVKEAFVGELSDDQIHNKKLKSPAQIEKALGAKRLKLFKTTLDGLTIRPVTGTNLVRTSKTTRTAVAGKAERFFEPVTNEKE
jgi:hypothetical protein